MQRTKRTWVQMPPEVTSLAEYGYLKVPFEAAASLTFAAAIPAGAQVYFGARPIGVGGDDRL
jgi:hypothetical protein